MEQQPAVGQDLLIIDAPLSHSDTPHSEGLLRTGDQPEAEKSDKTQQSQGTNIHASGGILTHNPTKPAVAEPRLRPRCQWDRQVQIYSNKMYIFYKSLHYYFIHPSNFNFPLLWTKNYCCNTNHFAQLTLYQVWNLPSLSFCAEWQSWPNCLPQDHKNTMVEDK